MKILSILLLLLLWLAPVQAETVSIGVLAYDGKQQALNRWQPTADYLSRHNPEHRFQVLALSHAEFEHAINKGVLDFILTNPSHYIRLEVKFGVTRIATFVYQYQSQKLKQFSAVIFTRADSDITTLQALAGHSLAAVNEDAFGGFQLAQDALLNAGINPLQDMSVKWLGFPHADVVNAVLAGQADAGTVRSGILEKMAAEGSIDLSRLRILGQQQHAAFPLLHSVDLYPEWAFARLPATDTALAKQVTITLLQMPDNDAAALQAGGAGWTIPLNYDAVHEVLRRLQVEPYLPVALDFSSFWQAYRYWIGFISILLMISLFSLLHLFRSNQRLKATQQVLNRQQYQLEQAMHQRGDELQQTNQALQNKIESHIIVDNAMNESTELIQTLYEVFMRDELSRPEKLCIIVDSVRQFLGTEQAVISRYQDGRFVDCNCSPSLSTAAAPLSPALAQRVKEQHQLVFEEHTGDWHLYIGCPVLFDDQLHYLLEFGTASHHPLEVLHNSNVLSAGLSFKMLNLIAQWISQQIQLIEEESHQHDKNQAIKQRLAGLTPRENQVLQLLAKGESTKAMARIMGISTKTIDMHRANLLRKSRAKSSTELVQLAVLSGVFEGTGKNTV